MGPPVVVAALILKIDTVSLPVVVKTDRKIGLAVGASKHNEAYCHP
jgi:hypothetical protein